MAHSPCLPARRLAMLAGCVLAVSASAHSFKAGDIVIEHPYALPSPAGARTGAMYLRALRNTAQRPDRLLSVRTPAAATVEIHHMALGPDNVMRMRAVDALPLPPATAVKAMHGGEWHLMLMQLTRPLQAGDRFPATLRFERGGEREVMVVVQAPSAGRDGHDHAAAAPP
jgi:copper(I)-binding protein